MSREPPPPSRTHSHRRYEQRALASDSVTLCSGHVSAIMEMMEVGLGTWQQYNKAKSKEATLGDIFIIHRLPFVVRCLMIMSH